MSSSTFLQKYVISQRYLTKPSKRRPGTFITPGVKFIVAHDTGNPGANASANVTYYERSRNAESASAHIFVDDKSIIECIPALTATPEKAWHVLYNVQTDNQMYGYNANDAAIGVEYCYGGAINADEAYRKYVWVMAYICFKFKLDPATSIVAHAFLDPKRKTDPMTGLAHSRRTYDQLLLDVVSEYHSCINESGNATNQPAPTTSVNFTPEIGSVLVTTKLNIRKGKPSRMADVVQEIPSGAQLNYVGWVNGEAINGNPKWYRDANSNYFWSGATFG